MPTRRGRPSTPAPTPRTARRGVRSGKWGGPRTASEVLTVALRPYERTGFRRPRDPKGGRMEVGKQPGCRTAGPSLAPPSVDGDVGTAYTYRNRTLRRRDMLLIGFVWIFIGLAALVLAKPFAPG